MAGEVILSARNRSKTFGGTAAVMVLAGSDLATIGPRVQVVEGGIFVLCVLGFRAGMVGTLGEAWVKRGGRTAHAAAH